MKAHLGMAVVIVVLLSSSANAQQQEKRARHFYLDKSGGGIEVRVTDPKDKQTREEIRHELREAARTRSAVSSEEMQKYPDDIKYRYEKTALGARLRIMAKSQPALRAVQDFFRFQMSDTGRGTEVTFTFIGQTSLVVVPVTVNNRGPYKFLLDTGASNSILSAGVAENLQLPIGKTDTLFTAGGNIRVTLREINTLQIGDARLDHVEIAVGSFGLLKTLAVDGILGGDYLRRFKISIDYEK